MSKIFSQSRDIGGQDKIRALWRHYYTNSAGIIFVIDSCDKARIDEATMELNKLLKEEELWEAKILILANKQVIFYFRHC